MFMLLHTHAQQAVGETPPEIPRGYRNETFLKAAVALGFLDLIETKPALPADIEEWKGIVYRKVDTTNLRLDIYRHKGLKKRAPVLVFIHGGAWAKGKRSDYLPYLIDYAQKGYVTVTVSYRLSGVAHFPAALEDVKCAMEWIRAHADTYLIDPDRMALVGGSAGAHLAMMAAYTDETAFTGGCTATPGKKVRAIVSFYGPTDLTTEYARNRGEVKKFLGKSYEEAPSLYSVASPRFHISADDPPTLIFQGTIDALVPVSQADSLHRWLDRAGVPNQYHRLKGWPHTMDLSKKVNAYCQYYMDAFFKRYL